MPDEIIDLGGVDEPSEKKPAAGMEVVVVADEQGRSVHLSCVADLSPVDLIDSALNLIQQVTRAALNNPPAMRVGDLGLGEDVPW